MFSLLQGLLFFSLFSFHFSPIGKKKWMNLNRLKYILINLFRKFSFTELSLTPGQKYKTLCEIHGH